MITDTSQSLDLAGRHSIVAYDLRTVICIPLRKPQVQTTRDVQAAVPPKARPRSWARSMSTRALPRAIFPA